MFCPRCSQPQASEQLRFCSRCGFEIESVRALVEREEVLAAGERVRAEELLPRQRDLSLGAGLMFAGGLVAVLWGFVLGTGPLDVLLPQAFFILGFTLAFVLLFFHPLTGTLHKLFSGGETPAPRQLSKQQDGVNLGAILMFIGTLKAMLMATLLEPGQRAWATLLFMAVGFLVLLVLRRLVQAAYQLLFKGPAKEGADDEETTARLERPKGGAALPPARAVPVNDFEPTKAREPEPAPRPSVTEGTTELLDEP